MQLKQIEVFQKVADLQSFSEAVNATGLSQPTLSRLIKQLEEELEVELIDRYHRPLQLTPAGSFFYNKIEQILKDIESTVTLTKRIANPPDELNIGFVPSVLYGLLPVILAKIKLRFPHLEIHLKDISSFKQIDALRSGELDVSFSRFEHNDKSIKQILLRYERYIAAVPKNHVLADKKELNLSDFKNDKIILYHQTHLPKPRESSKNWLSEPLLHLFDRHLVKPHHTTTVSDIQLALGLVAAGEGITLVPDCLKTVRPDQILYRPLIHEDCTSPIYLCTLDNPSHPLFTALLEIIYEVYEVRGITYRNVLQ